MTIDRLGILVSVYSNGSIGIADADDGLSECPTFIIAHDLNDSVSIEHGNIVGLKVIDLSSLENGRKMNTLTLLGLI